MPSNDKILTLTIFDNVAVVKFDDPNSKVNTLNTGLTHEFEEMLDAIESNPSIKAVVLISGKPDCFIAGADIAQLNNTKNADEGTNLSLGGQKLLDRVVHSKKPIVAAINGSCLGGGLEVALACHYRIATDHAKTTLALPEVMLGLLPGAGGTQRLPRLVGIQVALDMMLTGKNIRPKKAYKMGLVDRIVTHQGLGQEAIKAASDLADGTRVKKGRKKKLSEIILEGTPLTRTLLFSQANKILLKKTRGLYPAPLAILDVVKYGFGKPIEKGLAYEAKRFGTLTQTPESKSLISLFFGQTALKKNRFGKPEVVVKKVGVLGAGLMGAGIALISVQKGYQVLLKDIDTERLQKGKKIITGILDKKVIQKTLSETDKDRLLNQLSTQTDYKGFDSCHIVIEAVFEDLNLKHNVLKEVEAHVPDHCIFASNTSALPINHIAQVSRRPQNVVGMHYFSPVHKMPLLEVIITDQSSKEARAQAVEVGIQQGKTVIVVHDSPGFYTSRILAPFMDEAIILALEGVDWYYIDSCLKNFGFPVGPITLLDEVGIDVAAHASKSMGLAFGGRITSANPEFMKEITDRGLFGRKAKKGFYLYEKKTKGNKPMNPEMKEILNKYLSSNTNHQSNEEEIQKRMALRMVNEAVLCLQDNILENPVDGDIGAVFGLGFPPFLGGPFRYIDFLGPQKVVDELKQLADKFGKRFEPAPLLVEKASSGKNFH